MKSRADRKVAKHLDSLEEGRKVSDMNPRPPLGTKVTFDGVEGRVRGYITARHRDQERSVVVELKQGFFANTQNRTTYAQFSVSDIYLSSVLVHASNLKDMDGNRRWALPEELGNV